jgi:signal transduction histidine kinase
LKKSLFARYFSLFAWVILVSITLMGVMIVALSAGYFSSDKLDVLSRKAGQAADVVSQNYIKNDSKYIDAKEVKTILSILSQAAEAEIFLSDLEGKVVLCLDNTSCASTGHLMPAHIARQAKAGEFRGTERLTNSYKDPMFIVGMPVEANGQLIGILFATQSAETMSRFLLEVLRIFLLGSALVLIVSFVAIYFSTETLIRPLRAMARATESFSKGDFSARVPVEGDDEIEQLAMAFNKMAASLAALEETRREFVANVSHELRTPMTSIGGFIDGILDGTIPPDRTKHYLQTVSREITRLSRLVISMLNISRIEAGELKLTPTSVDIHDVVVRTVFGFESAIEEKQIIIQGLDAERIFVKADSDMLHQIIYNLVDNAVKFTPPNGSIDISYAADAKMVHFLIRNTGRGIPKDDLPYLFDRFYKADRSRSTDKSSVGLGLYIVKSLVYLNSGTISANSEPDSFIEFIVTLPAADMRSAPQIQKKAEKTK